MKVYIVIELGECGENPRIGGVFKKQIDADKEAYRICREKDIWCNVLEREVK